MAAAAPDLRQHAKVAARVLDFLLEQLGHASRVELGSRRVEQLDTALQRVGLALNQSAEVLAERAQDLDRWIRHDDLLSGIVAALAAR
jgi:hypothetical protein